MTGTKESIVYTQVWLGADGWLGGGANAKRKASEWIEDKGNDN